MPKVTQLVASKWQSQDWSPGSLAPESVPVATIQYNKQREETLGGDRGELWCSKLQSLARGKQGTSSLRALLSPEQRTLTEALFQLGVLPLCSRLD